MADQGLVRWWRASDRGERGAVLVEAALVLPVVLIVLFGTITGGLAYSQHNALNNAARETSRYGATLVVSGTEHDFLSSLLAEAKAAATGDLDAGVGGQRLCVAYVHPDGTNTGDRTVRLRETAGTVDATVTADSTCFADGRPDTERRIQVELQRTTEINVLVTQRTVTLTARSVSRYERAT